MISLPNRLYIALLLPGRLQIIDSVGHNDADPQKFRAINDAQQVNHVLLFTEKANSKVDVQELMKMRAFRESFMAFRNRRPGSYSVAVHMSW
jgi:hypothetical protein